MKAAIAAMSSQWERVTRLDREDGERRRATPPIKPLTMTKTRSVKPAAALPSLVNWFTAIATRETRRSPHHREYRRMVNRGFRLATVAAHGRPARVNARTPSASDKRTTKAPATICMLARI